MIRTRRSAQVLTGAILAWLVLTAAVLGWIGLTVLQDPSSYNRDMGMFALILFSPQVLVALVGLAALVSLARGGRNAGWLGMTWAFLEIVAGVLLSLTGMFGAWRLLGLLGGILTDGLRVGWDAAQQALTFTGRSGTDWIHWNDILGLGMMIVAVVGLGAAIVLHLSRQRPVSGAAA
jgi:hypothetical protein